MPRSSPVRCGLVGSSPIPGFAPDSPMRRAFPSHHKSSDDDRVSTYTSISDKPPPPIGGMEVEGAAAAGVAVTLMVLTPLGEGVRRRMDFRVRSRFLNSEVRKAILMMWPVPSGSGLTASHTIMITMRIHTSCPW